MHKLNEKIDVKYIDINQYLSIINSKKEIAIISMFVNWIGFLGGGSKQYIQIHTIILHII